MRLSLRDPPCPRSQSRITFDVRSRARWSAVPQQAVRFYRSTSTIARGFSIVPHADLWGLHVGGGLR